MHFSLFYTISSLVALISAQPPHFTKVYGGEHAAQMELDPVTGVQTATNSGEHPFIVSVEKKGRHSCGGTLIKDDVVLTAAHCTNDNPVSRLQVRAGIVLRGQTNAGAQVRKVLFYVNHPSYSKENVVKFDISLIKLQGKFVLNKIIGLATLPGNGQTFVGKTVLMLGWGEDESGKLSQVLKRTYSEVISNDECEKRMHKVIADDMLCSFDRTHRLRSVCSGDSGGPVIAGKNTVIGVNSWVIKGEKYCNPKYPAVFANIGALKPWIKNQLATKFSIFEFL